MRMMPHVLSHAAWMGYPRGTALKWLAYEDEMGWRFKDGSEVTAENFRRPLRMFAIIEERIGQSRYGARQEADLAQAQEAGLERQRRAEESKRAEAARQESAWALCAERCAKFQPGKGFKCLCGHALPPDLRERPCPPEECNGFTPHEKGKGA